jgi:hypothetical protein
MSTTNIWYVDSTMILELRNLTDGITGDPVTTATVTATLLDSTGAQVSGITWPISLVHVAEGTYRGAAPYQVQVTDKGKYTARIFATIAGVQRRWDIPVLGKIDTK